LALLVGLCPARAPAEEAELARDAGIVLDVDPVRLFLERRFRFLAPLAADGLADALLAAPFDATEDAGATPAPALAIDSTYRDSPAPTLGPDGRGARLVDLTLDATTRLDAGTLRGEGRLLGYASEAPAPDPDDAGSGPPRLAHFRLTGERGGLLAGLDLRSASRGIDRGAAPTVRADEDRARV